MSNTVRAQEVARPVRISVTILLVAAMLPACGGGAADQENVAPLRIERHEAEDRQLCQEPDSSLGMIEGSWCDNGRLVTRIEAYVVNDTAEDFRGWIGIEYLDADGFTVDGMRPGGLTETPDGHVYIEPMNDVVIPAGSKKRVSLVTLLWDDLEAGTGKSLDAAVASSREAATWTLRLRPE